MDSELRMDSSPHSGKSITHRCRIYQLGIQSSLMQTKKEQVRNNHNRSEFSSISRSILDSRLNPVGKWSYDQYIELMRLQRGRNDSSGTYTARGQPISTPKYLPDGICPWFNPSKDCWFGCPSAWKPPILEGLEWGHALARNKFWNFKRCSWTKTFRTYRLWGCRKYLQLPQRA